MRKQGVNQAILIGDTHSNSQLGLCRPRRIRLHKGGYYEPNKLQRKIYRAWEYFWNEWVPEVTREEPFALIHAGDQVEGRHHDALDLVSGNCADQKRLYLDVMRPIVKRAACFYAVKGTRAHAGAEGETEELLAEELGAVPDEYGQCARDQLWVKIGKGLAHILHHIGTTGSSGYESTAVMRELVDAFKEAGQWKQQAPDIVIRAHRHRYLELRIPSALGYAISLTLPGWEAKTYYAYRIAGIRQAPAQIGGVLVRQGDKDFYTLAKVWPIGRPRIERLDR